MPQCGGSTEFIVIRGSAIALSDFLYFWATWDETRVKAARLMTGTTGRQRLSAGDLGGLELRLPPILTQRRIVDVLASVDAYIAALQQQADEARTARNAVLHELLTAGGDDWTETTIGATSHFVSARLSPADLDPDMPYIGLEHLDPFSAVITRSGFATNVVASVTPFEGGDVLFGRLRPYLHKVAFATFSGVCSPEVLVLRALPNCEPKFLHALCSADATVKACVEMSAGTRMPRTNASDLASIKVALPPLSEQKRIVEVVAAMEAIISTTEQTVRDAQNLRSGLLSDLISGGHEIPATYDRLLGAA
jgi:type I restriction enzyme S subunit